MSVLRIRALERLAALVGACVPELSGRICAGAAQAAHRLGFPHLSITAQRFTFFPDQALEHLAPENSTRAVYNVGRVEATVQLRLGASSSSARYRLEQQLLERVWWADLGRPGIVLIDIPDCDEARVAFELDEDEWQDEKAFDREWYSVATAMLQMPALVGKLGVPTIDQIVLTLGDDLAGEPDANIDEDGLVFPDVPVVVTPGDVTVGFGSGRFGPSTFGVGL